MNKMNILSNLLTLMQFKKHMTSEEYKRRCSAEWSSWSFPLNDISQLQVVRLQMSYILSLPKPYNSYEDQTEI